jgi:hypothetical protein
VPRPAPGIDRHQMPVRQASLRDVVGHGGVNKCTARADRRRERARRCKHVQ